MLSQYYVVSLMKYQLTLYRRLHVQSKPLDIVYNPSTIARVKQFFAAPLSSKASMYQLQQELQSQTTEELKHRFEGILEGNGKVYSSTVLLRCMERSKTVCVIIVLWLNCRLVAIECL